MSKIVYISGKPVHVTPNNVEDIVTNYAYSPVDEVIIIYYKHGVLCELPNKRSNSMENKFLSGDDLYLFGLSNMDIYYGIKEVSK